VHILLLALLSVFMFTIDLNVIALDLAVKLPQEDESSLAKY
jgi:biopolymer transport protein ExbD